MHFPLDCYSVCWFERDNPHPPPRGKTACAVGAPARACVIVCLSSKHLFLLLSISKNNSLYLILVSALASSSIQPPTLASSPLHQKHIPPACLMPAASADATVHGRIDEFAPLFRPEAFWNLWEFRFFCGKAARVHHRAKFRGQRCSPAQARVSSKPCCLFWDEPSSLSPCALWLPPTVHRRAA